MVFESYSWTCFCLVWLTIRIGLQHKTEIGFCNGVTNASVRTEETIVWDVKWEVKTRF